MQLERESVDPDDVPASAYDVAEYVVAMGRELAEMARQAGLDVLARSLEETRSVARATLISLQAGNAAPDDAA